MLNKSTQNAGITQEVLPVKWRLSVVAAALMMLQAVTGLVFTGMYRDPDWIRAAWYGNDLVTAFVAAPLLFFSLKAVRGGSRRFELIWYSMLGYCVYNYAYYLFGARLNWFFPLYVVLFAMPLFILILALGQLDVSQVAREFSPKTPVRWVGGYMFFTGIVLTIAWLAQWLNFMLTGRASAIGEDGLQLIASMDLSFMVPWFILGAVLLQRRHPWGYIVAIIAAMKGATYTLVLAASSTVAAIRGVEGTLVQVPVWTLWTLAGGLAVWRLLANLQETKS